MTLRVHSPIPGRVLPLTEVADPAFAPNPSARHRADSRGSPPACDCTEPRSAVVISHGVPTQLYTSAVHRHHPNNTIHCLRGAQEITADYVTTSRTPIGEQR